MARTLKPIAVWLGLVAVYFVAGKLGLRLAFVNPSATAVWPPTAIALVAFLLLGYRVWPAIFAGAFLVNALTAGTALTSLGIATGNTLEGLVGAWLVNRFANGSRVFEHAPDIAKFTLAALVSTSVSASIGVATLMAGGLAAKGVAGTVWITWWLGDASGDLVVAPLALLWANNLRLRWRPRAAIEAAALFAATIAVARLVFGPLGAAPGDHYPLEFLCVPLFIWAAYRFGPRTAATTIAIVAGIAIWETLLGRGPFARSSPNESLLLLQTFVGVASIMSLVLAAVVADRRRAEDELRRLAVTDGLTGLGNYRHLIRVLEGEVRRAERTDRSFAVLFLDVDGLKKINDRHGHLVGSRALCRVAEVLHASCRAMDTAARFGGDEFALVLPETAADEAHRVGARVAERIREDQEAPPLSVSVGVAVYPEDGRTAEALLGCADRELYDAKKRGARPLTHQ